MKLKKKDLLYDLDLLHDFQKNHQKNSPIFAQQKPKRNLIDKRLYPQYKVNVRNPLKKDFYFKPTKPTKNLSFTSSFETTADCKFEEDAKLALEAVAAAILELPEEAAKLEQAVAELETEFDEDLRRALLLGPDGFSEGTIVC